MVSAAARRDQLCHMTPSCDITKLAGYSMTRGMTSLLPSRVHLTLVQAGRSLQRGVSLMLNHSIGDEEPMYTASVVR